MRSKGLIFIFAPPIPPFLCITQPKSFPVKVLNT
jgi:hypothetical protein